MGSPTSISKLNLRNNTTFLFLLLLLQPPLLFFILLLLLGSLGFHLFLPLLLLFFLLLLLLGSLGFLLLLLGALKLRPQLLELPLDLVLWETPGPLMVE